MIAQDVQQLCYIFYEPNCLINLETRTSQGKERSCLEIADAEVQVIDLGGLKKVVR